jgi:putative glutamine amidotransferase
MHRPTVLIPTCNKVTDGEPVHVVGRAYVDAVVSGAGCQPLLLPPDPLLMSSGAMPNHSECLLARVDGVLLTGSPSNVHPKHYRQDVRDAAMLLDPARDASTLPLIRQAIALGVPLLAICRGFQEVNVALGGTLHQAVHKVPGLADHRDNGDPDLDVQYRKVHRVSLTRGGLLQRFLDGASEIQVNSLHGQGIDALAADLMVEARADDGLVEAVRIAAAKSFGLAVQWHPEWRVAEDPVSSRLFAAFGDACREHAAAKRDSSRVAM